MKVYLITRTHGLYLHLLKSKDYDMLVQGKIDLNKLGYNVSIEKNSVEELLNDIVRKFINRILFLEKVAPEYSSFFRAFLERLEVENIKAKLRYLHGVKGMECYYPYEFLIDKNVLISLNSEREIIEHLRKTPLDIEQHFKRLKGRIEPILLIAEVLLDIKYYEYYFSSLRNLEKTIFQMAYLERIITLIYWYIVLGEEQVNKFLSTCNTTRLRMKEISRILELSQEKVKEYIENREYTHLAEVAENVFIRKLKKLVLRNKNNMFFVYYYMFSSYAEMRNLERIVLGRKMELRPEIIRGSLKILC